MKVPHPIQYQGSKRALASTILRYLPDRFPRLAEPFAGTAAVSIACAVRRRANSYWLNDLNKPLAELLGLIINHPGETADFYEALWNQQHDDSLEHYYRVREDFNRSKDPRLFLYLLARCVKGSVRYNSEGLFNQSPDKRRHGAQPATMRENIFKVSSLLIGKTNISALDYNDMLPNIQDDDVVYMDPPYQGVCGDRDSRYLAGVQYNDFVAVLEELNRRNIRYAVSYDGRTGSKTYGNPLPESLSVTLIELEAGRSTQATLLKRSDITVESLYLSSRLADEVSASPYYHREQKTIQLVLMDSRGHYATKASKKFLDLCKSIQAKRPKTVIDHILKHGFITTEELKVKYGYNHPPRAARDVRDYNIPLETFRMIGSDGRKMAAYRFGDIRKMQFKRIAGRTALSKKIKKALIDKYGADALYTWKL